MDKLECDKLVELPKLRKFISVLMSGKSLDDEYISHCSKCIFEFIKNSERLMDIFEGMKLVIRYIDDVEVKMFIKYQGKELNYKDLHELAGVR